MEILLLTPPQNMERDIDPSASTKYLAQLLHKVDEVQILSGMDFYHTYFNNLLSFYCSGGLR